MVQGMQTGTPMGMLSQNNPQLKQVYDFIRSCGGNAQQAFYAYAQQTGKDPNTAIQQARSYLGK